MSTSAYAKILQLGDKNVADIFDGPVEITEKVDGSQIGFGWIGDNFIVRSHGREIFNVNEGIETDDKMFKIAVQYLEDTSPDLPTHLFFYGECLTKPRHSTLAYDRMPKGFVALFGARRQDGTWVHYGELKEWADALGFDIVPLIYHGISNPEHVMSLLDRESFLGGEQIEGVVVKRYMEWLYFGEPRYIKTAKFVSDRFKEVHKRDWKALNAESGGIEKLKEGLRSEARWRKAIQHLRERGEFSGSVKDIGPLMREISVDIEAEEQEAIKDALYSLYRKELLRAAGAGLPDWFKSQLALGEFAA